MFRLTQTVAMVLPAMATFKCLQCGVPTDTLAPSGRCTVCVSNTEQQTRPIEPEAATLTHDPLDTATHDTPDGWAGVLPAGGYRYEEEVGKGGMGVVWRAVRISTGETVAIKKLRPENFTPAHLRRFVAEARALPLVRHENVVLQHDFVPDPADPYLVLEFVSGESLGHHIKSVGPLHPDRAARMIAEAAAGVQAAHAVGIIHRDLKPGNLLLTERGSVKVADFGLGKVLAEAELPTLVGATTSGDGNTPPAFGTLTATGRLAGGTPGFMAPEQVSDRYGEVGVRADVFGLGACLFACLTAQAPFPVGRGNAERVLTDALVPPRLVNPSVPADLSAIVEKCLRKDPALRYESAAAVAADLKRYLDGEETTARRHPWARRQWRKVRTTPAWVFATAVAVLAVAVGIGLAVVPKLLKETPESIQEGYRRDLKAGKTVTLIGETELPRHFKWQMGSPELKPPSNGDGACAFESVGNAMFELLDDPGIDHYIVRAQIKQLDSKRISPPGDATANFGSVGLYTGYTRVPNGRGGWVTTQICLRYEDYAPQVQGGNKARHRYVNAQTMSFVQVTDELPEPFGPIFTSLIFQPPGVRPGLWRTLEIEVSPAGISPRWGTGNDPVAPLMGPLVHNVASEYTESQKHVDSKLPGSVVVVPPWSPRLPLGLYSGSSALTVKNVTVVPVRTP